VIDLHGLDRFGVPGSLPELRGTEKCRHLAPDGSRGLLFLFAERHGIKLGIREHLLNAVDLSNHAALSCVGVEVPPNITTPDDGDKEYFRRRNASRHAGIPAIIDEELNRTSFPFWTILNLLNTSLLPPVSIISVEDENLRREAGRRNDYYGDTRSREIVRFLRGSSLYDGHEARDDLLEAVAAKQWEHELAEEAVNVKRSEHFLEKMFDLWDNAGRSKPAILNAGAAHQYRIARELRKQDQSFILIEQP
jgi:hypothetical protein